jgi:hypothetical protein
MSGGFQFLDFVEEFVFFSRCRSSLYTLYNQHFEWLYIDAQLYIIAIVASRLESKHRTIKYCTYKLYSTMYSNV